MKTKHLTVMFTDIKNFTGRSSKQTREELLQLLEQHDELIRPIIKDFKGTIIKGIKTIFKLFPEHQTEIKRAFREALCQEDSTEMCKLVP